jgi:hypothetical protein
VRRAEARRGIDHDRGCLPRYPGDVGETLLGLEDEMHLRASGMSTDHV